MLSSKGFIKRIIALVLFVLFLLSFVVSIAEDYIPGTWLKRHMVDSFGDPREDKYIYCVQKGTFERFATSVENDLVVTLQIGEDSAGLYFLIDLYQYGSKKYRVVNEDTSKITKYTIRVKEDDGTVTDFPAHMYKIDKHVCFEDNKEIDFINMMKKNEVLKVIIMDEPVYRNGMLYDYYSYHFNLEYPDNFIEAYEWLGIENK